MNVKNIILFLTITISILIQFSIYYYLKLPFNLFIIVNLGLIMIDILLLIAIFIPNKNTKNKQKNNISNLDGILKYLNEGVMIIKEDNTIKFFNPSAESITGFSKQDVLDIDYQAFFKIVNSNGSEVDALTNPIKKSIANNLNFVSRDFSIRTASNRLTPLSINIIPIAEEGITLITFRDISKELDEERDQLEFISTASHEMRTPVASIEGYLGLALNPKTSTIDERAKSYINKAQKSAKHLGVLFQNLLSISKAEDKRLQIRPVLIDLAKFLEKIVELHQTEAKKKNLKISFDYFKGHSKKKLAPKILVFTDKDVLMEIVSNLIENAIKYTDKGFITVSLGLNEQGNAQIGVKDTGIGIPNECIPHLFQKFYRVDNTATREIGGTGLGLFLARKLTNNIQGQLWVESELGKGSTFFLSLPRTSIEQAKKLKENIQNTAIPQQTIESPMSKYHKNTYGNNINKGV